MPPESSHTPGSQETNSRAEPIDRLRDDVRLMDAVHHSINGIAAGLQTTG